MLFTYIQMETQAKMSFQVPMIESAAAATEPQPA